MIKGAFSHGVTNAILTHPRHASLNEDEVRDPSHKLNPVERQPILIGTSGRLRQDGAELSSVTKEVI